MDTGEGGRKEAERSHVSSFIALTWLFLPVTKGVTGRLSSASHTSLPLWMVRGSGQKHLLEAPKGNLLHVVDVLNDFCHYCICSNLSFLSHFIRELLILVHSVKKVQDFQVDYDHANVCHTGMQHSRNTTWSLITTMKHPFPIYFRILLMSMPFTCS